MHHLEANRTPLTPLDFIDRSARAFYDIPHHRTVVRGGWSGGQPAGFHPFAVGPWRAPGASTNAFARESQIDVLAARAGMDPVEFRLKNLADPRMIRAVNAVAKKAGWTPKATPSGRGIGIACGIDAGTYAAVVAACCSNFFSLKIHASWIGMYWSAALISSPSSG